MLSTQLHVFSAVATLNNSSQESSKRYICRSNAGDLVFGNRQQKLSLEVLLLQISKECFDNVDAQMIQSLSAYVILVQNKLLGRRFVFMRIFSSALFYLGFKTRFFRCQELLRNLSVQLASCKPPHPVTSGESSNKKESNEATSGNPLKGQESDLLSELSEDSIIFVDTLNDSDPQKKIVVPCARESKCQGDTSAISSTPIKQMPSFSYLQLSQSKSPGKGFYTSPAVWYSLQGGGMPPLYKIPHY